MTELVVNSDSSTYANITLPYLHTKIDARDFDSDVMVQGKSICVLCILGFQHENPINPKHIWHKC